ncbi:hypothetical protein, partial [Pedobacter sp.]|uniref:hypothetical protein n=1 Tax=Pedobacter sp. TaxID=1411316 RepID=UPI002D0ED66C
MKFRKYCRLILISVMFFVKSGLAQDSIYHFLATLNNRDVISYISWVAPDKIADSGKIYAHTFERILKSIDVSKIRKTYPKYLMIENLVLLLDDPDRDWYADLLLYNLTRLSSINVVGCDNRNDWLRIKRGTNFTYKHFD